MNPNCITPVALAVVAGCGLLDSWLDTSPLSFSIYEGYFVNPPPPPPHIALIVTTETQYPCMNYRLDGALRVAGTTLRVDIPGTVREPRICLTAIGPAGFRSALPVTTGTYTLEFRRAGLTDRYLIRVTVDAIEIATIESHFTTPTALSFPRGS
jgi:hypothetical protein